MPVVNYSTMPQDEVIKSIIAQIKPPDADISLSELQLEQDSNLDSILESFFFLSIVYAPELTLNETHLFSVALQLLFFKTIESKNFTLDAQNLLFFRLEMFLNTESFTPQTSNLLVLDIQYATHLKTVDISECTEIRYFKVCNSQLESIDFSANEEIRYIILQNGKLEKFKGLEYCHRILELWLSQNDLVELPNLYLLQELKVLNIDDNKFTFLDFTNLKSLERLSYLRNPLRYEAKIPYSLRMANQTYLGLPEFPEKLFILRELKHNIMRDPYLCDIYDLIEEYDELFTQIVLKRDLLE